MAHHRRTRERLELARVAAAQRGRLLGVDPDRQIAVAQVVGGGQVGDDVGGDAARDEALHQLGGVDGEGDRQRLARARRAPASSASSRSSQTASTTPASQPRRAFSASASAITQTPSSIRVIAIGCAAPIPPRPPVTTSRPRSVPPKCSRRNLREGLVGSLQDALGADVLPAAGGQPAPRRSGRGARARRTPPASPSGRRGGRWPAARPARAARSASTRDRLARLDESVCRRPSSAAARGRSGAGCRGHARPWHGPRRRRGSRGPRRSPGCSPAAAGSSPGASRGSAARRGHQHGPRRRRRARTARVRARRAPARRPRPGSPRLKVAITRPRSRAAACMGSSRRG